MTTGKILNTRCGVGRHAFDAVAVMGVEEDRYEAESAQC
jgi:hypothetical protein